MLFYNKWEKYLSNVSIKLNKQYIVRVISVSRENIGSLIRVVDPDPIIF